MKTEEFRATLGTEWQGGQYHYTVVRSSRSGFKIKCTHPDKALALVIRDKKRPIARETEVESPPGSETLPEGPLGEVG